MCSVVEIKNGSEYYIHYHSPESLDTIWSEGADRSLDTDKTLDCHPLFTISDLETKKGSLTSSDLRHEHDFSEEEIESNNLTGMRSINEKSCNNCLVSLQSKDVAELASDSKQPKRGSGNESKIMVSCEEIDDNIGEETVVDDVTLDKCNVEIVETSGNNTQVKEGEIFEEEKNEIESIKHG